MRNVMLFSTKSGRHAIELAWVQEVATLGFVSAVPTAPAGLVGVCNVHGVVMPVLDAAYFTGAASPGAARQGDAALIINIDGILAALRVAEVLGVIPAGSEPMFDAAEAVRRLAGITTGAG